VRQQLKQDWEQSLSLTSAIKGCYAAIDTVTGFTTGVVSNTAVTLASGDSLTVRNYNVASGAPPNDPSTAKLLSIWSDFEAVGMVRIFSPRLHDAVNGIRLRSGVRASAPKFAQMMAPEGLYPQDTLTMQQTTGAAGSIDTTQLLIYYPSIPGLDGTFISTATMHKYTTFLMGVEVALTTIAGGGYQTTPAAINATFDNFKVNQYYCILGATYDIANSGVSIRGTDTGNLRCSIPGSLTNPELTTRWFPYLSDRYGLPLIPVFNSANRASVLVEACQIHTAVAVNATILLGYMPAIVPAEFGK